MGGIIIDARAILKFEVSLAKLTQALKGFEKIQKGYGAGSLRIETVPSSEGGTMIHLTFKGSPKEFETLIVSLDELRGSVAIETVPLPERQKPVLDQQKGKAVWGWTVNAIVVPAG
jgi:hypothetical protein